MLFIWSNLRVLAILYSLVSESLVLICHNIYIFQSFKYFEVIKSVCFINYLSNPILNYFFNLLNIILPIY